MEAYASSWTLHRDFDGSGKMRKALSSFYKETLIAALHRYCNRHAPILDKDEYLVSVLNGYKTAVSLEVKPDFLAIQNNALAKIGTFNAYLKVDEQSLKPMPISVKLLELLVKIGQGYRPNKHDKNAYGKQISDLVKLTLVWNFRSGSTLRSNKTTCYRT